MNNYFLARRTESLEQFEDWLRPASDEIKIIPPKTGSTNIQLSLAKFKRLAFFSIDSDAPFCVDIDSDRWHVSLTIPMAAAFKQTLIAEWKHFQELTRTC